MTPPRTATLPRLRSGAASLSRRIAREAQRVRASREPAAGAPGQGAPGLVELFSRKAVKGWISVLPGVPPTRVTLHLDDLAITSTYAAPEEPGKPDIEETPSGGSPSPHQHLPSRGDELRHTGQEIRWFRFRLDDVWRFCAASTQLSVRVDGVPLPIAGHGMYLLPDRRGGRSPAELRRQLESGHVFSQKGVLQTSKQHDTAWQGGVMRLFGRTDAILREAHGYEAFFVYGTLLGAVREGTYIGHDVDFDAAYVSSRSGPGRVSHDAVAVALTLIDRGLDVTCLPTHLHVSDPAEPDLHIDLFHTYFGAEGVLRFPFGVAGTSTITRQDWKGVRQIPWTGGSGSVPVNAEQVVECLYGADWRQPKPGFHWPRDRVSSARGKMTRAQRSKVYWTNFYAHTSYSSGSTFSELLDSRPDTPRTVIDIGCGDGRDSCAFGQSGRQVLGIDQSPIGVQHAAAHASALDLQDSARFTVCDVAETEALTEILDEAIASSADEPVMFYLRFFLHSIPEGLQDSLMAVISASVRPGDVVAAEFRTEADEAVSKVHGQHYRRYQDGPAFGDFLRDRHFAVLHEEEGTGLSPYKGEDPVLYRVIARREAG